MENKKSRTEKICSIAKNGVTFGILYEMVDKNPTLKNTTAKQRAEIIRMLYFQKEYGWGEAMKEVMNLN